ncbi:MAG: GHKL domain-containing protein [Piscirickettsiaceae bacterium]|nr:GHKL domain-containing protein [Piscirickettsiaceae bacterium]
MERRIIWQSNSTVNIFIIFPKFYTTDKVYPPIIDLESSIKLFNVIWENKNGKKYFFTVNTYEDINIVTLQTEWFQRNLWYCLGGAGIILLSAQYLTLRWVLRLLDNIAVDLYAIESGDVRHASNDCTREFNQLTMNINNLLKQERLHHKLYKNSLADLAHSLKTHLAIFRGELDNSDFNINEIKATGHEQLDRVISLIDYQLQRVFTNGHYCKWPTIISLGDIVDKIVYSLNKVYQYKKIYCQYDVQYDAFVNADSRDMYELLGNLLENSYKYCNRAIHVTIISQINMIEISIEDDGDGIPDYVRQDIMKRGWRVHTQIEGQGLGLAIVSDIVKDYKGDIKLKTSHLGGACVIVQIPYY